MTTQNQPQENELPQDDQQVDDEFESAFYEFSSGDEDRSAYDEPNEPEPTENEPEPEPTPREQELQAQLDRLRHADASNRGRLGAYQRKLNELEQQLEKSKTATSGQDQGNDDQRQDMAESMGMEDWDSFAEDFPDMARAFEARLKADRQKQAQLEQQIAEMRSAVEPIQQQAQETHLREQEDALTARHPDWREVVAAPAFAEWLNQQPESLRQLTNSNDAAEAAALLDLYRSTGAGADSRADTHDKRQSRLAAAQNVSRRGAAPKRDAPDDFESAFDHFAAKKKATR